MTRLMKMFNARIYKKLNKVGTQKYFSTPRTTYMKIWDVCFWWVKTNAPGHVVETEQPNSNLYKHPVLIRSGLWSLDPQSTSHGHFTRLLSGGIVNIAMEALQLVLNRFSSYRVLQPFWFSFFMGTVVNSHRWPT
jgi:hypothetical protein